MNKSDRPVSAGPVAQVEVERRAAFSGHRGTALVLGGGVALGAFGAGAYAALERSDAPPVAWVCGASIGAVLAAIIAGNEPSRRIEQLERFWNAVSSDPAPAVSFWFGTPASGPLREWQNQASVMQTLLAGRPDLFRPRLTPGARVGAGDVSALYDLEPLRRRLADFVDFDRLNDGPVRVTIATTAVLDGDRVTFDTAKGARIGPEHLLASCALLPVFAPVEVDGRLLADGGLSSNTPLDLVLTGRDADGMLCCVVDLFAQMGQRPHTLAASASRATDLVFGNQTRRMLEAQERERRLRAIVARLGALLPHEARADAEVAAMLGEGCADAPTLAYVAYRAGLDEAGVMSMFDFSRATVAQRWEAGARGMREALAEVGAAGVSARAAE